jgi:transposase
MKEAVVVKDSTRIERFVGLDVHAESIAVAVAEAGGEVRSLGVIPNRVETVRRLVAKLGAAGRWRACYEAGPTGYGERVKTDRLDARRLAQCFRAGDLTPVWVPDAAHEALRDLVRAREAAKRDQLRARHRLGKFLLRQGRRAPQGIKSWTVRHLDWVRGEVKFEQPAQQATLENYLEEVVHQGERIKRLETRIDEAVEVAPESMRAVIEALQALRGVAKMTAVTVVSEVGQLSRFGKARQLMGYSGAVASEHSSGERTRRGGITKTGNAHLRRVLVEAAWCQRFTPTLTPKLRARQQGLSAEVVEIATKARHRLHARYRRLVARGKTKQQVVTAIARELLGFVWAIGVAVERKTAAPAKAAA